MLFMNPGDTPDLKKQYDILNRELEKYNPELLDKRIILAIFKADMLDEELIKEMEMEIPK